MTHRPLRSARPNRVLLASLAALVVVAGAVRADEPVDEPDGSFRAIVEEHTLQLLDAVGDYVQRRPEAEDVPEAYAWLFEAAERQGLEHRVIAAATAYLERDDANPAVSRAALRVRAVGRAKQGRVREPLDDFVEFTRTLRLRSADEAIDFAVDLATEFQLVGEPAAARESFERLSRAFFLNETVKELAANRVAKLELVGEKAPPLGLNDLSGETVDLADYEGKVLLVDFWATNCRPCLVEFPMMKELYAAEHEAGFEIVGVSLDEEVSVVERFVADAALPWRMAMSTADQEETRARYRARTIPSTLLVDRDGKIAFADVRGEALKRAVRALLEAKPEK